MNERDFYTKVKDKTAPEFFWQKLEHAYTVGVFDHIMFHERSVAHVEFKDRGDMLDSGQKAWAAKILPYNPNLFLVSLAPHETECTVYKVVWEEGHVAQKKIKSIGLDRSRGSWLQIGNTILMSSRLYSV